MIFDAHPWSWPWIFKIKFWNSCVSGIGGSYSFEFMNIPAENNGVRNNENIYMHIFLLFFTNRYPRLFKSFSSSSDCSRFVVVCCGYIPTHYAYIFQHYFNSIGDIQRLPTVCEATLLNIGKLMALIHEKLTYVYKNKIKQHCVHTLFTSMAYVRLW